jgi:hypothetical protein
MSKFELWLDINCVDGLVCTLFGEINLPVRPQAGERISFHQGKGTAYEFQVMESNVDLRSANIVSVEVEEVSHYGFPTENGVSFKSVLYVRELRVATIEDARVVRDFLTTQSGLSVDPYGINRLDDGLRHEP